MAFGAPDGVRLSDMNLLQYPDVIYQTLSRNVLARTETDLVNITGVGCLGGAELVFTDENSVLYIYLDGEVQLRGKPFDMLTYFGTGSSVQTKQFGIGKYDTVNNIYSVWFNADYKLWFRKSLHVYIYNSLFGAQTIRLIRVAYKLRS